MHIYTESFPSLPSFHSALLQESSLDLMAIAILEWEEQLQQIACGSKMPFY